VLRFVGSRQRVQAFRNRRPDSAGLNARLLTRQMPRQTPTDPLICFMKINGLLPSREDECGFLRVGAEGFG
jgi:hypothetical protein